MSGYKHAFDFALQELQKCKPEVVVRNALADYDAETGQYVVPFFKRPHVVSLESGEIYDKNIGKRCSLEAGIMIMHYLTFAKDVLPTGRLITLKEVPGGEIFFPSFKKVVIRPIARTFSHDTTEFMRCASLLCGEKFKMGHISAKFEAFPKVPLVIALWEGDEEVPGAANFLFDSSVEYFSPTETIIGYGYYLVNQLVKSYQKDESKL